MRRGRIGLNGLGAGFPLLATACAANRAVLDQGEPDLVLAGHIRSGGPQQVLIGQDPFDTWSLYMMEIVARPTGGSFGEGGGPGKIISMFVPRDHDESVEARASQCPSDVDPRKRYLVVPESNRGRKQYKERDNGIYFVKSCAVVEEATPYGFLKD